MSYNNNQKLFKTTVLITVIMASIAGGLFSIINDRSFTIYVTSDYLTILMTLSAFSCTTAISSVADFILMRKISMQRLMMHYYSQNWYTVVEDLLTRHNKTQLLKVNHRNMNGVERDEVVLLSTVTQKDQQVVANRQLRSADNITSGGKRTTLFDNQNIVGITILTLTSVIGILILTILPRYLGTTIYTDYRKDDVKNFFTLYEDVKYNIANESGQEVGNNNFELAILNTQSMTSLDRIYQIRLNNIDTKLCVKADLLWSPEGKYEGNNSFSKQGMVLSSSFFTVNNSDYVDSAYDQIHIKGENDQYENAASEKFAMDGSDGKTLSVIDLHRRQVATIRSRNTIVDGDVKGYTNQQVMTKVEAGNMSVQVNQNDYYYSRLIRGGPALISNTDTLNDIYRQRVTLKDVVRPGVDSSNNVLYTELIDFNFTKHGDTWEVTDRYRLCKPINNSIICKVLVRTHYITLKSIIETNGKLSGLILPAGLEKMTKVIHDWEIYNYEPKLNIYRCVKYAGFRKAVRSGVLNGDMRIKVEVTRYEARYILAILLFGITTHLTVLLAKLHLYSFDGKAKYRPLNIIDMMRERYCGLCTDTKLQTVSNDDIIVMSTSKADNGICHNGVVSLSDRISDKSLSLVKGYAGNASTYEQIYGPGKQFEKEVTGDYGRSAVADKYNVDTNECFTGGQKEVLSDDISVKETDVQRSMTTLSSKLVHNYRTFSDTRNLYEEHINQNMHRSIGIGVTVRVNQQSLTGMMIHKYDHKRITEMGSHGTKNLDPISRNYLTVKSVICDNVVTREVKSNALPGVLKVTLRFELNDYAVTLLSRKRTKLVNDLGHSDKMSWAQEIVNNDIQYYLNGTIDYKQFGVITREICKAFYIIPNSKFVLQSYDVG